jgi:phosphate-selective porin OprO and OprP
MRTLSLALATLAVLAAPPLRAQEKPAGPPAPTTEADKSAEKPLDKRSPTVSGSSEGGVQWEGGSYRIEARALVQVDGRFFEGDEGGVGVDGFLLRRVWPILQGTVAKHFDFNITPDFGGGTTVLQDAYLDVRFRPEVRLRAGKFKPPTGIERLQSASNIAFVERAFPTALVPNRDVGVQLHGELAGGVVAYATGIFDGAPDGGSVDTDLNDGKDFGGRIFVSPFKSGKSVLRDLGFGIMGSTGKQTGPLPAYRSNGQVSILTLVTGITYDGTRKRYVPQLSYYAGPFGLLAEYAHSESTVKKTDGTHVSLEGQAWQTTVTLALTGDKASFTGVKPKKPFDPAKGQWGALELAARVNGIEFGNQIVDGGVVDPTKTVRKAFAWGAGLNWSLNRNVKQMLDYERTSFTGGAAGGKDRAPENALFIRSQISF